MDPVEVTAKFDERGGIEPQHFTWRDKGYPVLSVGRHWVDEDGHHVLAMVPGNQVFELILSVSDFRWYLEEPQPMRSSS